MVEVMITEQDFEHMPQRRDFFRIPAMDTATARAFISDFHHRILRFNKTDGHMEFNYDRKKGHIDYQCKCQQATQTQLGGQL